MKKNILALISRYRTELMGFAALWVLADHEWISVLSASKLGSLEGFIVEMGYFGVDFFLFLSGIGLVYAIGKYTLTEFYKRRFVRILVPLVVTVSACAVARHWDILFFLKSLVGYHFWAVNIYTVLWYVYAIMTLYLVFPLYNHFFQKAANQYLFTAVVFLVWFVLSNALSGIMRYDLYGFTNRIPVFLTGVLAGYLLKEKKTIPFSPGKCLLCVFSVLLGAVLHYLVYRGMFILVPSSECFLPPYLIAVFGSCVLVWFFSLLEQFSLGQHILRLLTFYGTISLELYCVQEVVLGGIGQLMVGRLPNIAINLINYFLITLAAYALHKLSGYLNRIFRIG